MAPSEGARALQAMVAPVRRELRLAGDLSVLAGALWAVQAVIVAQLLSALIREQALPGSVTSLANLASVMVPGFLLVGGLRAWLAHHASGMTFEIADRVVSV